MREPLPLIVTIDAETILIEFETAVFFERGQKLQVPLPKKDKEPAHLRLVH